MADTPKNATPLPAALDPNRNEKGQFVEGNKIDNNINGTAYRPSTYRPELVKKVYEYLAIVESTPKKLAAVEDFALWIGEIDENITNWANARIDKTKKLTKNNLKHPDFFTAIKALKSKQKMQLMKDGFYGGREVNAAMAMFLLKCNHGFQETTHIDHTTKGDKMPTPIYGGQAVKPPDDDDDL